MVFSPHDGQRCGVTSKGFVEFDILYRKSLRTSAERSWVREPGCWTLKVDAPLGCDPHRAPVPTVRYDFPYPPRPLHQTLLQFFFHIVGETKNRRAGWSLYPHYPHPVITVIVSIPTIWSSPGKPIPTRSPHEPYSGSRRRSSNFGSYQKTAKSHWLLRLHGSHCFLCSPPLPPRRRSSLPPT